MDTPTQRIIAEAAAEVSARDALGRRLSVRRMSALDRLRLFKAIGSELAQNSPYLGVAMLASSVTAIDDIPVPAPTTERQLEALVQRLGDEGLDAIADALAYETDSDMGTDTPGNSAGTPI